MATSLQQQLAAINSKSTNQLNLKAQKARHSQSLLYEPSEAASQSFETIFQICQEGFAELCQLDRRYVPYSQNLFEENSITVEREQMTASENEQLNAVISQFLGLLSGRLLLRPAQKCMEWLVRRWRIHDYNTSTMLYAVLPYHGHDMFATVLSILPKKVPHNFTFLQPYISSLRCPPRHALITAAVQNDAFIKDFSTFVLDVSRKRLQSSILVGSWISVLAQSLNARLDDAQSGRDEVRRQRSENILLAILPTLQDMLAIGDAPDIYLAACMLMTILATKIDLEDSVLDAFMESVVSSWSRDTIRDGVECLALLAEEKDEIKLSRKVYKAIVKDETILPAILAVSMRIRTEKLLSGILDTCSTPKVNAEATTQDIVTQIGQHLLEVEVHSPTLVEKLTVLKQTAMVTSSSVLRELLNEILEEAPSADDADIEMDDADAAEATEHVEEDASALREAIAALATPVAGRLSFLTPSGPDFSGTLSVFERSCSSASLRKAFVEQLGTSESYLAAITFLARCWTSSQQALAQRSALDLASEIVSSQLSSLDLQAIQPYVLVALADGNAQVRRAAAKLVSVVSKNKPSKLVWAKTTIYGDASDAVRWLPAEFNLRLIKDVVSLRLEECILDQSVLKSSIVAYLNDGSIKPAQRTLLASYLSSHALTSPVEGLQQPLFNILQAVEKSASEARMTLLAPFVKEHVAQPSSQLNAVIKCLTLRTDDELQALQSAANHHIVSAYGRIGEVFTKAKPEPRQAVLTWLLSRALTEDHSGSADALQTLRAIKLPVDSLAQLLSLSSSKQQESERPTKRQRVGKSAIDRPDAQNLDFTLRRASACLEIVEDALSASRASTDDQQYAQLVKQLFSLLGDVQSWRTATGSDLTYLQVLTLNNILATLNYSNAQNIDRAHLRTDMVVETLRSTASPQVHNSALLVISKIATFAPDTVLHSVMPLFTFMSSSTLRQVDAYSVHVINMTIESIVPPLRESLKARGKDLVAGASDLLLSFSAAFEHIPGPRRHDTFVQLLKVLGPEESLYAILAMLVERYHEDTTLVETLRGILDSFKIDVQLKALTQYLDLVLDASKKRRTISDSILGFSEKNAAEANASVAMLLDGWANLVESPVLQGRVASELRKETGQTVRDVYGALLEKLVALPHHTSISVKFDEPTLKSAHDVAMQALLALLPTEDFINSSSGLMQGGSEQARVKVFASLTHRVNGARSGDAKLAAIFLETLPNCSVFVSDSMPITVRRAALDCMDAMIEKFGKQDRQAVATAVKGLLGPAALLSSEPTLQTASLLCFASSVEVLGEEFVSIAGDVLDRALKLAAVTIGKDTPDWTLIDGVFTVLNAVLDHQAWLLSAALLERALVIASHVEQVDQTKSLAVQQYYQLVPGQLPLRELATALVKTFGEITGIGEVAVLARARLVRTAIAKNTKTNVTKTAELLSTLTLDSFSLRPSTMDQDNLVYQAYKLSIDTTLEITLKMNDLTFRPLFMKIVSWAEGGQAQSQPQSSKTSRMIVLFDFAQRLFEQLGSIVTSYASFVLEQASAVLNGSRTDDEWSVLASVVLHAMTASFQQDQDDFWSAPQHFDTIAQPLLKLLSSPFDGGDDLVNNTIVELSAAVSASPELLKSINAQIMTSLRHQSAAVRLAALRCERKITEKLTFDWLQLLPEMLPYISELLEDDDEAVELEVLGWVKEIEDITGESLEGMLA